MKVFKISMIAAVVFASFAAISSASAAQVNSNGASLAAETTIKCDDSDMDCARVGPVTVLGKGTIIVKD